MGSRLLPSTISASLQEHPAGEYFANDAPVGYLVDRIMAMRKQEITHYNYYSYCQLANGTYGTGIRENDWREKICHWTFGVVDHFGLSRGVVAISLSLFDRFLATRGNKCTANSALLISLTTLHIALKLNEYKRVRLATLANLSRGQFGVADIEEMEWHILIALSWRVHPPTEVAFIYHFLQLLPPHVHSAARKELFELSRYLSELSLCDAYFVKFPASTVACASILNVIEERSNGRLLGWAREKFCHDLADKVHMPHNREDIVAVRCRLREMFADSLKLYAQDEPSNLNYSEHSTSKDDSSRGSSKSSIHSIGSKNSGSIDSAGSWSRYSSSPQLQSRSRHRAPSPCASNRNRKSKSSSFSSM